MRLRRRTMAAGFVAGVVLLSAALSEVGAQAPGRWGPLLRAAGIKDERVIRAMEKVRRADFLPLSLRAREMDDEPLPIGFGQTTSQPSLVALMIEELRLQPGCSALEVGTGSGYLAAILGTSTPDLAVSALTQLLDECPSADTFASNELHLTPPAPILDPSH